MGPSVRVPLIFAHRPAVIDRVSHARASELPAELPLAVGPARHALRAPIVPR